MATPPTQVLVRVQARGGKFLGPDIDYSFVQAIDVRRGTILDQGYAAGDSGQIQLTTQGYPAGASPNLIIANGGANMWWLYPTEGALLTTAGYIFQLPIAEPTLVEFRAIGRAPHEQAVTASRMWVHPGVDLLDNPGVVLVMDGLDVQIQSTKWIDDGLFVSAHVAMMCGCKIENAQPGTPWPWPAEEFVVTAASGVTTATLTLDQTTPSLFEGVLAVPRQPLTLAVSAVQRSQSNQGFARADVSG